MDNSSYILNRYFIKDETEIKCQETRCIDKFPPKINNSCLLKHLLDAHGIEVSTIPMAYGVVIQKGLHNIGHNLAMTCRIRRLVREANGRRERKSNENSLKDDKKTN